MRLRLTIAVAMTAAACSLGDFAGYSGGNATTSPDASSEDATASGNGDGASDAGSDATTTTSDGGDAGAFCQTLGDAAFFCEDFEGPNPLLHFSSTKTVGGTLVVDKGQMVVDAPASDGGAEVFGVISPKRVGSVAEVAFSVSPEVLNTTTDNANQLVKVYFFADQMPSYEVGVGVHGAGLSTVYAYEYTEGAAYKEFGELPPLAANATTRFVFHVTIAAAGPRVTLDRDGMRVVDAALSPPRNTGAIEAYAGLPFVPAPHGAWRFRLDDIALSLP